uniref:Uncharacterized protein n=1 Tax=Macrostomum lignano TaxID=282301 RepID=A0A1I8F4S9_9PLAT
MCESGPMERHLAEQQHAGLMCPPPYVLPISLAANRSKSEPARSSVGKFGANHQAGEFQRQGSGGLADCQSVLCQGPHRLDAVAYGERLLLARVLRHEQQAYHFRDSPDYRYVFSEEARVPPPPACPEAAAAATAGDAVNRRCGRCVSLSSRDAPRHREIW